MKFGLFINRIKRDGLRMPGNTPLLSENLGESQFLLCLYQGIRQDTGAKNQKFGIAPGNYGYRWTLQLALPHGSQPASYMAF